jgi:catechol 2,3-dioxygenase-like lactoylglutathione lyase family enzyme
MIEFGGVSPILPVANLERSIDHYVRILGFEVGWHVPSIMASVSRGRTCLFLCEGDQGHTGTWVWIGVNDAQAVFEEYQSKGAKIRHPPTNYEWTYELQVEDPDGNILRLGSHPLPGQPIGEWLDMHNRRWAPAPNGGWKLVESDNA